MAINSFNDSIRILAGKPIDDKFGPFNSIADANIANPQPERYNGLTFGVYTNPSDKPNSKLIYYYYYGNFSDSEVDLLFDVVESGDTRYIRFDTNTQGLTTTQQQNARTNINALIDEAGEGLSLDDDGRLQLGNFPIGGAGFINLNDLNSQSTLRRFVLESTNTYDEGVYSERKIDVDPDGNRYTIQDLIYNGFLTEPSVGAFSFLDKDTNSSQFNEIYTEYGVRKAFNEYLQFEFLGNLNTTTYSAIFRDSINNKGLVYDSDYSISGTTDNRWIPDWGAVKGQISGLEAIDEGNGIGWRLIGVDSDEYGNIGSSAVDLSIQFSSSTTTGATGFASVALGATSTSSANYTGVLSGRLNSATNANASVQGGFGNTASGDFSSVSGGNSNSTTETSAFVGAGNNNVASGNNAAIVGGSFNISSGDNSNVSGGYANTASGSESSIIGGENNTAFSYGEIVGGLNSTEYTPLGIGSFEVEDRIFNIGNGDTPSTKSDAFTILKNGLATLPSVTNTLIDGAGVDAIVTKDWVNTNTISVSGDTMTGSLLMTAPAGIDSIESGTGDTLNIGTANADVINIGWSGTTLELTTNWTITTSGILQSNEAQTIETSSGDLTLQPSNNILIGNGTPTTEKLQVNGNAKFTDDIEITGSANGVILTSPDATRWRLTVDNSGNIITTSI